MNFTLKENDTKPILTAVLQYADGTALDLTGASVYFVMRDRHGIVKVMGNATILVPASGKVEYQWQKGDTDTEGPYEAEFVVMYPDGFVQTVPSDGYLAVRVLPQLAKFIVQAFPASLAMRCPAPNVFVA